MKILGTIPCAVLIVAACGPATREPSPVDPVPTTANTTEPPPPSTRPQRETVTTTLTKVGLDPDALDKSVNACDDFYEFACGGWIKNTQIPSDKARWSRSFSVIDERNEADLRQILETAAKGENPKLKKLGEYWSACMDEGAVEKAGAKPIQPLLARAAALGKKSDITKLATDLHKQKLWALFDVSSEQDFKEATRYLTYLDQNGLGLPDRDYYTKEDDKSKKIRDEYLGHVKRMFVLLGTKEAQAEAAARDVMEIETELAKVSKTRVERRNPQGLYNKMTPEDLAKLSPNFDFKAYLGALKLGEQKELIITSKPFFEGLSQLIESVAMAKWQSYFRWQIVHRTAKTLSKAFSDEDFTLEKTLAGTESIRPRWKRCIDATDEALGELLGEPFVDLRFGGKSKEAALEMVKAIGVSFGEDLPQLKWMDEGTRTLASEKQVAMAFLIGYPESYKTYDFPVKAGDYAGNVLRGAAFDLARKLSRIGKPVNRGEWEMTPPTVNAYYNPLKNQMVFPAGILQPPFYSVNAATAVNLGAMGMVVGHELTHGFDDEGSQFDKDGNLREWWTADVKKRFQSATQCVEKQYSNFEVLPGVKLNGKLTLGENIADNGGVKLAFYAYRALTKDTKEGIADGYNEDQQFFLSMAQVWCSKQRDEYARMVAAIDPHSAPKWRVNGSMQNQREFAEAFSCKPGTKMNPVNKCVVW
jgi:putative endopeptidase